VLVLVLEGGALESNLERSDLVKKKVESGPRGGAALVTYTPFEDEHEHDDDLDAATPLCVLETLLCKKTQDDTSVSFGRKQRAL
jgi:hypothetical protein